LTNFTPGSKDNFDRTNAILAGFVFVVSFIVYAITVQRTFSFWDCGEFIACSYTLGIPHPPGTPLFVLVGRLISVIPFVEDISHRINYLSVIGSAFTAMFSYLLTVRLAGYIFGDAKDQSLNRYIAYIGGLAGAFFVAFSRTNWGNSVEAEVYGMALALSVCIVWLTLRFFETRGTMAAAKAMIMVFYLAVLGIGAHMTVFLVVPVCSSFFILKREATPRDWAMVAGYLILELFLIILYSNGRGGSTMFYLISFVLAGVLVVLLYRKINWAILAAVVSVSSVMLAFSTYLLLTPVIFGGLVVLAILSMGRGWKFQWQAGMAIIAVGMIGMSVHAFIPIGSSLNPNIDENNPSRNWRTFVNFLDRKQYGQVSMIDRMFERRGAWSNHFGRHAHMGFWSYFEEQYSSTGWGFVPFFLLGLLGLIVAIKTRIEVGLAFLALLLLCSAGLILYMNFADGTKYSFATGDAYLEVRNRDYFFTPAFVFFGIAMGLGLSALLQLARERMATSHPGAQKTIVMALSVLVLLPGISLARNWHPNDRSQHFIPYNYAKNLLDTCEENSILFTAGDNDTFPLWCIQEVYKYRTDVRVVNLSLLNTDWYVLQMKERYGVPISLTKAQIEWNPYEIDVRDRSGKPITVEVSRPDSMFHDRPRGRMTYMVAGRDTDGTPWKVQDMMVDEIVIQNAVEGWKSPIFFSSQPYAESPLNLREKVVTVGLLYRLEQGPITQRTDTDKSFDLYMNTYNFDGYKNSDVFRDENATGVFLGVGINAIRVYDELLREGDTTRAIELANYVIDSYPEYWQMPLLLAGLYEGQGDSATGLAVFQRLHDSLEVLWESNPGNQFYMSDLGLAKVELGQRLGDPTAIEDGTKLLYGAFDINPNAAYAFRKIISVLSQQGRFQEITELARKHAEYKVNQNDPYLRRLLGMSSPTPQGPPPQGP